MSGIEGYYYNEDEGFEYYPGAIFSKQYGPRGGKRKLEPMEREFWQEVSTSLQENYGLGAYQARKKIYESEERFMGASPRLVEITYHYSPRRIAEKIMEYKDE